MFTLTVSPAGDFWKSATTDSWSSLLPTSVPGIAQYSIVTGCLLAAGWAAGVAPVVAAAAGLVAAAPGAVVAAAAGALVAAGAAGLVGSAAAGFGASVGL